MRLESYLTEASDGVVIKNPKKASPKDISDFFALMEKGESYSSKSDIKKHGIYLGYYYIDGVLASIAAIKDTYRMEDLFEASETEEDPDEYEYELGWAYTLPEYRSKGLNKTVYKELLKKVSANVMATARTDNKASIKGLESLGFEITGESMDVGVFDIYLLVKK